MASDRDRLAWIAVRFLEPRVNYIVGDLRRLVWLEREHAAMERAAENHLEALRARISGYLAAPVPSPEPVFLAPR